MIGWDTNSAIRERLALLATQGPDLNPKAWAYDPHKDSWYYRAAPTRRSYIQQEGSKSLDLILRKWRIDRHTAMALIGYPDQP